MNKSSSDSLDQGFLFFWMPRNVTSKYDHPRSMDPHPIIYKAANVNVTVCLYLHM